MTNHDENIPEPCPMCGDKLRLVDRGNQQWWVHEGSQPCYLNRMGLFQLPPNRVQLWNTRATTDHAQLQRDYEELAKAATLITDHVQQVLEPQDDPRLVYRCDNLTKILKRHQEKRDADN